MKQLLNAAAFCVILLGFSSCQKDFHGDTGPTATGNIIFKFKFDSTQERLNNIGLPAPMPAGHAGLSPKMNVMSAHYVELAQTALTQLGAGAILYRAPETNAGGSAAIDFSKAILTPDGGTFLIYPIRDIPKGEYEYLRVSLAYQNYDVVMHLDTIFSTQAGPVPVSGDFPATAAAFVGYNTFLSNYTLKTKEITVNGNRAQGYWGCESNVNILGNSFISTSTGQAPPGATTVVNPINSTSPIPAGSCVATGAFKTGKLKITGDEKNDIVIVVSLSVNKSFEWIDANGNGKWDVLKGEAVVDMGVRGLIPYVQ
jgi:hypothetical protein